jgi:2-hydroxycyclohexanecarboxyl-CoA dehydrogenase
MELGLKDKVVIVTGSASGIGKAVAKTFGEEGAKVVVADILDQGAETADEIIAQEGEAVFVKFDFTKLEEARRVVKETVDRFGHLDVLANIGAAWRSNFFMQMTEEDWDFEITCVFRQVLNMCRASLEHMIERRSGKIINTGSDAGRVGEPNQPVYSGAKGGVIALTKALAKDVARHGILVNCVCPSMTMTERTAARETEAEAAGPEALETYRVRMEKIVRMYPLRKLGTPQDVANMVVFLASERASHITGQTVSVNGGYCMV